ncbi:MAG: phosphoribosylformylglycinamidine cyclo-ligase [Lachnospirales bacterium]
MEKDLYEQSGVSLEAGYESVRRIKEHIAKTFNIGCLEQIGGFGGLFDIGAYGFKNPLLVSGTDGVGTKLEIAKELEIYDTIGIDLVAMCVNDVITLGAKPLYFLDYIAIEKNYPEMIENIVKGICTGLKQCDCALIGGETAELPGLYPKGGYDLAGFVTAAVEKDKVVNIKRVEVGDVIVALPSSGIHSNGYSLVRKIIKDNNFDLFTKYEELDKEKTLGEVLLTPTNIYVNDVLKVLETIDVHGIAHITGGGFYENIPRATNGFGFKIFKDKINTPNIFKFLQKYGNVPDKSMYNYFNMGVGMILILKEDEAKKALNIIDNSIIIGEIIEKGEEIL